MRVRKEESCEKKRKKKILFFVVIDDDGFPGFFFYSSHSLQAATDIHSQSDWRKANTKVPFFHSCLSLKNYAYIEHIEQHSLRLLINYVLNGSHREKNHNVKKNS
jgi:hypothetical protein